MNNQKNTTAGDWFFIAGFLIRKAAVITMWLMEGLLKNISIFRRTIIWMIVFTVAVYLGKPAVIGLLIFAIITGIIAWVKLGVVIRTIGNKIGAKNEKIGEVFNKIADVVEKFYPTLRKIVRVFSFVPDFQRFGKLVQRNVALAKGNAFMKQIGAIPTGMSRASRQKYSVYMLKEHNGEIVKDNKETMGNQVIYFVNEKKYPELPLFKNNTFDSIIKAAESKVGSVMTDVTANSFFMGNPAMKVEFISDIDNAILEGNQFLKDEGIVNENDNNLYDVEAIEDQDGITIYVNDKISNNVSDVISKFKKAADNHSVKYMDIEQNGFNLVVKYLLNVDPQVDRAHDLLRSLGVIQNDDKSMYDAYMFDNSVGNPTIVINKQIGYLRIEDVYNKLVSVRSNYGSKYVDLKPTNDEKSDSWMTFEYVRQIDKDVERAHDLLREANVIDRNSAEIYDISMSVNSDEAVFKINDDIYGKNTNDIVRAVEGYKERYNAKRIRSQKFGEGKAEIMFIVKDFLAETKEVKKIPEVSLQKMEVVCAVDAFGNDISINFKDISGTGIMGVPGSGKSGSPNTFYAALASHPAVDFNIIDCKGGSDWDSLYPASNKVIRGASTVEELQTILDYLKEVYAEMRERIDTMKNKTGGKDNYWNVSPEIRERENLKFKVILIDEFQKLFDSEGDRELGKVSKEIEAMIKRLISESRSSGIMISWITQRPVSEEVPSTLVKKTVQKIAFKTADEYVIKSFFGKEVPFGQPSPIDIPKGHPGRAVLYNDEKSEFEECRFYFINTNNLPQYVEEALVRNGKERNNTFDDYLNGGAWKKEYSGVKPVEEEDSEENNSNKDKNSENTRERKTRSTRDRSERTEKTPYHNVKDGASEKNSEREERMRARREAAQNVREERVRVKKEQQPVVKLEGQALKKEIIRINHMLRISEDIGASEDERANAKRMAEKAMTRHGITMKELTA